MWPCRRLLVPSWCCHNESWALTPRFHPYLYKEAVVFCYELPKVTPSCAFHRVLLYPVRTFLPQEIGGGRTTHLNYKDKKRNYRFILYLCNALTKCLGVPFWAEITPFSPDRDNAREGKACLTFVPPAVK